MLSAGDAEKLTIPLSIYASNDEPEDEVRKLTSTTPSPLNIWDIV
jgi:hypothetical protein